MKTKFKKRQLRTRSKLLKLRPRLTVYKSNKAIYVQIIDDKKGCTLASERGKDAKEVGIKIAEKAKLKKIKLVVFDKGGYQYHGKIKAVAEGAREGGLEF
ncbi:MAG: 50S ribosomal protein L18 [Candidatus Woesebacteria bacterium GW2011_GWA1_33_30]|uniref:Large ribosomal subunit protein uL18 n=1 Tax=Candidatus Woesebacteria bacterium GW2011_GWA2_33_28 TaxID=1618561 RepID=A0A0G0CWE7_9BACT|nr:MAG: 50S ribosomal protein L18 [Candidatus Woesebacteria bacterium GW2011_GWA2_33_28]KKP48579.1 MAG: 50S ribosomal protein L18 [Candidatus Woesebacteria bacterium GW2011_GWA1_33_30]KKP49718.1 MAG: 50S ribosomal protein L18 [Microgenomates group bacterium GW2011_GWC1_33_32]KKP52335.1 MAG: 50S ribosomal protein L18 [Candidatus Woesebacteria bacterium GW2011_GWB1_33_38]KKP55903.1 MAG: 50S ribosomal protein L18 [Microgenomates group bacterium GW2011_GWD1_33_9]